jgi:hypothetical protein
VGFAIESRFSTNFVLDVVTENQSAIFGNRHVFADVRGFSFVEGIAWQLFVAGGLGLRVKK